LDGWYRLYTAEEVTDPVGPMTGASRVMRGGRYGSKALFVRSAARYGYLASIEYGFRVIMELGGEAEPER